MSRPSHVTTLKQRETWVLTMIWPICYTGGSQGPQSGCGLLEEC